jgi:hypothetical protein
MQGFLVYGWREVLARTFAGCDAQYGVTPEWLVNPDTGRRLKLDYLYPEIGVAVRFVGLEGTARKRRKSDDEVAADEAREDQRAAVCLEHGIVLLSINPDGDPREALRGMEMGLARATSRMALGKASAAAKQRGMRLLSQARARTGEFTTRLTRPEALRSYAELWWDREAALVAEAGKPAAPAGMAPPGPGPAARFTIGMNVVHERFGPGQVTAVQPDGNDLAVTVNFGGAERTFLASLVGAKLRAA